MRINQAGLKLIKEFEGLRLQAYKCSAGVDTIGYGSTAGVKAGMIITQVEADRRLETDLGWAEHAVTQLVKTPLNENQFSALVSLVFNIGGGAFRSSTLLRKLNEGDIPGAAAEFIRWNKVSKKVVDGLTTRRAAETSLFQKKAAPAVDDGKFGNISTLDTKAVLS